MRRRGTRFETLLFICTLIGVSFPTVAQIELKPDSGGGPGVDAGPERDAHHPHGHKHTISNAS